MGVKSHRAKRKRLTTYDVAALRMIEPELPPEPDPIDEEELGDDQLTGTLGDMPQDADNEQKTPDAAAPKGKPAAKPAPEANPAKLPHANTVAGGVEFEIERAKGEADEMIDPEQLNLF